MKMFIFGIYSWLTNLVWLLGEIIPQFLRNFIFRLVFKEYGRRSFIDYGCYMRYTSRIEIGKDVSINRGCKFFASFFHKEVHIKIGNNVAIGPDATIFAAGHDYNYIDLPDIADSVEIGNNVWVGGRAIILPGVKIGEGCIIGAGSIVTKNIPAWSIAVGNPARVIKQRTLKEVEDKQ